MIINRIIILSVMALIYSSVYGQTDTTKSIPLNFHFQQTTIIQGHPSFHAAYSGVNSLNPEQESETSLTSTLFFGLGIFDGTQLYFNPELAGGKGLSGTTGLAGFANGEIYRVSNPEPVFSIARFFIRSSFALGGKPQAIEDSPNQLGGKQYPERIVITFGKFSLSDIFDNNSYSHDARSQFMNWSLMSSVAWDYPADTKGYTYSFALEYIKTDWAVRAAAAMLPKQANGMELDTDLANALGFVVELEKSYFIENRKAISRILFFQNRARMGNYSEVINNSSYGMDITKSDKYGRTKTGFAINNEYSVLDNLGVFLKLSWNDGKNETWAFTEVDRAVSLGLVADKMKIIKKNDEIGIAFAANGLSDEHREYLSKGGYGFIIGDGALKEYGLETIVELFFKSSLFEHIDLTADYQFVLNPAYNRERGPVHIFSFRVHIEL